MKAHFMTFLAATAPLASIAYTTSNAYPHNTFKPPAFVTPQQQQQQQYGHPQPIVQQRSVKYDLGLGKHAPIGGDNNNNNNNKVPNGVTQQESAAYEMALYCTEFQAVNALPNPSERLRAVTDKQAAAVAAANQSKNSRPNKPRILPKRFHEEDFSIQKVSNHIQQQHSTEEPSARFIMTKTAASGNFDLNTAWVEMLIHEQELKLQAA